MGSPAVNRNALPIIAGVVWTIVGLALCAVAANWLINVGEIWAVPLAIGIFVGLLVYRFGFLKLVRRNRMRLQTQSTDKNRLCLFAFQSWKSYIIIIVMVALGYSLRHSALPKIYLAPVYLAIGIGLLLASLHYYSRIQ